MSLEDLLVRNRTKQIQAEVNKQKEQKVHWKRRAMQAEELLSMLMNRITSEPTMSGHLRNMHLLPDMGDHKTSDAIRAARAYLDMPKTHPGSNENSGT